MKRIKVENMNVILKTKMMRVRNISNRIQIENTIKIKKLEKKCQIVIIHLIKSNNFIISILLLFSLLFYSTIPNIRKTYT